MAKEKLVLIGNGMAGIRTLEELLKLAPERYEITVFGAEPHGNYNRVLLSPVLAGEMEVADIVLNPPAWYAEHGIVLHAGCQVTRIDRQTRTAHTNCGKVAAYDRLLIATGSSPFRPPVPGNDLPGVIGYRDIADTEAMIAATQRGRHAVVIGGGVLGLEAANGLARRGMQVSVVHLGQWIMERQLDRQAAEMLQATLQAKGMTFLLGRQTAAIRPGAHGRVAAVAFAGGEEIPADLVVLAAGVRPNIALAEAAGLECQRAIVVDDTLTTSDPLISAVGECVSHRGTVYGLVAPLFEQAQVCAAHLAGASGAAYRGSVTSTKLKVTGIDVFSAGDFTGGPDDETIVLVDRPGNQYKKLIVRDGRLRGAVLYGDAAEGGWYFGLVRTAAEIGPLRDHLLFGQAHAESQLAAGGQG